MPRQVWVHPELCITPHRVGRFDQVAELAHAFRNGWDPEEPALVGYIRGNRIQLLSGTHRLAAALEVGLDRIPVVVWDYKDFDAAHGNLEKWFHLMASIKARDIKVQNL